MNNSNIQHFLLALILTGVAVITLKALAWPLHWGWLVFGLVVIIAWERFQAWRHYERKGLKWQWWFTKRGNGLDTWLDIVFGIAGMLISWFTLKGV